MTYEVTKDQARASLICYVRLSFVTSQMGGFCWGGKEACSVAIPRVVALYDLTKLYYQVTCFLDRPSAFVYKGCQIIMGGVHIA